MADSTIVSKQFVNHTHGPNASLACCYMGRYSIISQARETSVQYDVYDCDLYLHAGSLEQEMDIVIDCPFDGFMSFGSTVNTPGKIMYFSIGKATNVEYPYDAKLSVKEGKFVLNVSGDTASMQGTLYGHERFYAVKQIS